MQAEVTQAARPTHVTQLITLHDVCQLLGVDVWTVRRYAREGSIPAYKVGRGYRFDPDDVQAWLQTRRVHPAAHAAEVEPDPLRAVK